MSTRIWAGKVPAARRAGGKGRQRIGNSWLSTPIRATLALYARLAQPGVLSRCCYAELASAGEQQLFRRELRPLRQVVQHNLSLGQRCHSGQIAIGAYQHEGGGAQAVMPGHVPLSVD